MEESYFTCISIFLLALSILFTETLGVRLRDCQYIGEYIRDSRDPCIYYHCDYTHTNSVVFSPITRACAPGSAVPHTFIAGSGSPCSEINSYCDGVLHPGDGDGGGHTDTPTEPTPAPPTPMPPTKPSHGIIPDTGCPAPLLKYENTNVFGGKFVRAVMEEEGCKQFCLQTIECAAVDFDKTQQLCFVFTFENLGRMNFEMPCCNHYIKTTCRPDKGLPTKFLDYAPGYHVFGGIPLQGDHTLDECLAGCDKDLSCEAVDFNADKTCWFHNKTTSCNALSIKPYCTHYTTLTCGSPLPNIHPPQGFTTLDVGFHIFGGTEIDGELTMQECINLCRRAPISTCSAVDYDAETGTCFMHSPTTACNPMIAKNQCTTFGRVQLCADTKK